MSDIPIQNIIQNLQENGRQLHHTYLRDDEQGKTKSWDAQPSELLTE